MFVLLRQCGSESQATGHENQSEGQISGARSGCEEPEGGDGADHGGVSLDYTATLATLLTLPSGAVVFLNLWHGGPRR